MGDPNTERSRAIATDLEDVRKQYFDAGFKAGAESERARIQAVEQQAMPGHEELVAKLKFDGKTTGGQAALQILAAERKKLGAMATDLRADAPTAVANSPTENTVRTTQGVHSSMTPDQVAAVAKTKWNNDSKLRREFTSEAAYVAFSKAEAAGRVKFINKPRVQ